jgi:succinyl-CoA synthetase alpha subunit
MSILVGKKTRLVVQGITGSEGTFHTKQMIEYGTNVVAGVTPGKGGRMFGGTESDRFSRTIPVFDTVSEAVSKTKANASVIFVPPASAVDAVLESVDAGIRLVVVITEGIPALDMVKVYDYIRGKDVVLIGPNCPGIITPGEVKIGIMPGFIHKSGKVGVISRSGTLTYEAISQLTKRGIGQSTCVGIGGDPVIGTRFVDLIKKFNKDRKTDAIVMIGEIGGNAEEEAAEYIRRFVKKPVIGFIAGQTAPPGRRMGHAGAVISGMKDTAAEKMRFMQTAGITVVKSPDEIGETVERILKKSRDGRRRGGKRRTTKTARKMVKKKKRSF